MSEVPRACSLRYLWSQRFILKSASIRRKNRSRFLKKIILALTNENETVLDQFAGSFVTFWAAIATKRKAIAIELSEEFVQNQLSV